MRTLLSLFAALLTACTSRDGPPPGFDGARAFGYLKAQVGFGPRIPGQAGHEHMGDWLDSLLRARADTLVVQAWTHTTADGAKLPLRNFLARFRPAATQRILFLAHWDTRPRADRDPVDSTKPVPGANDGASGAAVLLGLADALKATPPTVGVDLLFVDGEDYGDFDKAKEDVLIGSRYYAANLPPGGRPLYAVLLDMVADRELQIKEEGQSLLAAPDIVDLVWRTARDIGYAQYFIPSPGPTLTDDHVELHKVGIRAIDVVDFDYGPNHTWWHTAQDTIDKVSQRSLQIVGDVMLALIRRAP
jgi:peptidase M28-like protein